MSKEEDMEKEAVEKELSALMEITLRLEDEVNSFCQVQIE
jgi:hypothetical protein